MDDEDIARFQFNYSREVARTRAAVDRRSTEEKLAIAIEAFKKICHPPEPHLRKDPTYSLGVAVAALSKISKEDP